MQLQASCILINYISDFLTLVWEIEYPVHTVSIDTDPSPAWEHHFRAFRLVALLQLRRGKDGADIHCIAFSPDSKWLVVSSDKATVHVFSVNVDLPSLTQEDSNGPGGLQAAPALSSPAVATANKRSSLSFAGGFLPGYFSSEWSSTQIRVPEGTKYLVAFGSQPNTVTILGVNGRSYRCRFDPEKGGVVDVRHKGTPSGSMEQDVECINLMNPSKKTSNSKPSYGS
nr:autophagy-related protein 18d-like [Aegilops tauschii subsp. strangulata]